MDVGNLPIVMNVCYIQWDWVVHIKRKKMIKKTILKAIIYRLISFCVVYLLVFLFTGQLVQATYITVLLEMIKTIQYFLYELLWKRLSKNEPKV